MGKCISFIHLFIERVIKETFTCGLIRLEERHITFMSRDIYIFHSFTFTIPSYLLSNLASWFSLKSDLTGWWSS